MTIHRYRLSPLFLTVLLFALPAFGQTPRIPIDGLSGTLALPSSVDKFYSDVNTVLVKTSDGVEHLVHLKSNGRPEASSSLDGLKQGMPVVVRYTVKGIQASADETGTSATEAAKVNEGTVTRVDRSKKEIAVSFADGSSQKLHLADANGTRVVVQPADPAARGQVYYFKPE